MNGDPGASSDPAARAPAAANGAKPPGTARVSVRRGLLRWLGVTVDLPRGRMVRWVAAAAGSCAAFLLLKLWLFTELRVSLSQLLYDLPFDMLAAVTIATLAMLTWRGARAVFDGLLAYCWLSMLYATLYGGFADTAVWRFRDEAPVLLTSFLALLTWSNALLLAGLLLVHRFVSARVLTATGAWPRSASIALLVCLALLGSQADLPGSQLPGACRGNPLTALLTGHDRAELFAGRALPILGDAATESAEEFNTISPYSHPKPPPAFPRRRIDRPNVVIVLLESTGLVAMQRPGSPTTPFLDVLAERGLEFTRFYSHSPRSLKSIFALHTGWYPLVRSSLITEVNPRLACKTLAEFFKEQGYRTVLLHGGFFRYTNKLNFLRDRG
ncbi:MAG: sulfatase-like hydrolase/transferase, partial [Planctomycetota bacterium]